MTTIQGMIRVFHLNFMLFFLVNTVLFFIVLIYSSNANLGEIFPFHRKLFILKRNLTRKRLYLTVKRALKMVYFNFLLHPL